MVQLLDQDIGNKDITSWRGLHLLHFPMSSCSQKLRIYLALKGIDWQSHIVDLATKANNDKWFMGINPRGLLPVLVHDGAVHIESNDILFVLEDMFPDPVLIPAVNKAEIVELLALEDRLHHDLRRLSFRFVYGRTGSTKTSDQVAMYLERGTGTVGGQPDPEKHHEAAFYRGLDNGGLSDATCREAAAKVRDFFHQLEQRLVESRYFLGETISVLDIAWYVYAYRMDMAGYPLEVLHPHLWLWFQDLNTQDTFLREVQPPDHVTAIMKAERKAQIAEMRTFAEVAGFSPP